MNVSNDELLRRVKWWETSDDSKAIETFEWESTGRVLEMIPRDISTGNRYKISIEAMEEIEEIDLLLKAKPHSKVHFFVLFAEKEV